MAALPCDAAARHSRGLMLATVGIVVLSFDSLLVRLAGTDGWNIAFWRGALMAIVMGLFYCQRRRLATLNAHRGVSLISAGLLAAISLLFVMAVMHTRVANVVVILSTAPLFAAIFTRLFLQEQVAARTWIAIGLAMLGLVIVFAGSLTGEGLLGDMYALGAAMAVGANLTLLRRYQTLDRLPLIAGGGIMTALVAWPMATPLALETQSYVVLAVMGLIQMPLATALINNATRYLPSAEVALFYLVEAILGTLWVWWLLGENPPEATLYGGLLTLVTLLGNAWLGLRRSRLRRVSATSPAR
ncbi:DMT family transporter [Kushneria marisflavi]|uniref:EamA family transporter n=1 Tax=Kushneria marisflavi TaxID=157779 RepID=A0A240UPB0_9GAMM|nr:DMT family transporter [Kushneria marisflavi]ART63321.1 EamA family transporter [Kushneria marisflavi]RKD84360.1 EamA-like transporter family protein [Kushneria marisflavi]